MSARTLSDHLRRYPVWYVVGAVWVVAMLSLPIVRGSAFADVFDRSDPTTTTEATGPGSTGAPGDPGTAIGPDGTPIGDGTLPADDEVVDDTTTPAAEDPRGDELALVPPELLDLVFDALPPFVFPALPDEVLPIARAVAPVAATGCSAIGLAGVIVAVAAQTAEGVPIERILPYLAPVSTACASFPIPEVHTVCEADQPFITDLGGLTTSPPILGLAIDQLQAIEQLLTNSFGVPVPALSADLRVQLGCELVK